MNRDDEELLKLVKKIAGIAIPVFIGMIIFFGGWYVVDPAERANIRRLGVVQYIVPVGAGLHFKLPLIDSVDKLQVSLQTLHIPAFDVTTIDNQKVTIEINFNYTIPSDKVNHILYEIGRSGKLERPDIDDQIVPVAKDRTARIFASQNMVTVNANRLEIQTQIESSISKAVEQLFGIEPHSLQIVQITPSPAFMVSNELAVKAKNDAVAAENTKRTRQFEADQVVIKAKGEADAVIEAARGEAESVKLQAQANQTKLEMEGAGQQSRLGDEIKPFGSPDKYIEYLRAKAALNWNGQVPQIQAGNGTSTNLVIPYQGK